jgi:CBS domain-containing protein
VTIQARSYAFEALLTMSRRNVHHLPVLDGDDLAGMVTTTDLMRLQAASPVYLIGDVWKQDDVDGLAHISERLPELILHLVDADATADDVGHAVTAVTDALTRRLLDLAEARLGPPPVPYAWVALGSQARHEQTAHSDQDTALLLPDEVSEGDDAYFQDLARFVSDGLHACGYAYCPGDVMATNATWRQPLHAWHDYVDGWINEPSPKALMHSSIFFDMRHLHGDEALTTTLLDRVRQQCKGNTIFLASLAANALQYRPPLGFFRQFVLERHGGQEKTLDLKHQGVVPAVDLARVYALGAGVSAINTQARLDALADTKAMAASDAANLSDAHAFIAYVRLQHQGHQLRAGEAPDNYVSPDALSPFERRHLKDAFTVISQMQSALAQKYQTSMIS